MYETLFIEINEFSFTRTISSKYISRTLAFFMHFHKHYVRSSNTCILAVIDIMHTRISNHESEKANLASILHEVQSKSNG